MTDPRDEEDLRLLAMIQNWMSELTARAAASVEEVSEAITAYEAGASKESTRPPGLQYPPCPICGAEVTDYTFNGEGPVLIEFRPCGNKIMQSFEDDE